MSKPRQRDELPLPHRKRAPLLANLGLQPILEHVEPVAAANPACRLLDFGIGRVRPGIANVLRHRAGKEKRRLRNHADLPAQALQVERADVLAIEQDLPALELVEARDQFAECRFARAGMADQGHHLARCDAQREVPQDRLPFDIGEVDIFELDLAVELDELVIGDLDHARWRVDQREDPLRCRKPLLELAPERRDARQREPEERDHLQEEIPIAGADLTVDHHLAAEVENRDRSEP